MKPTVFNYADHITVLEELQNTNRKNKALELANKRAYGDGFEDCEKAMGAQVVNLRDERDAMQAELARVTEERDAAVISLKEYSHCKDCKFGQFATRKCYRMDCKRQDKWEWRGTDKENAHENR